MSNFISAIRCTGDSSVLVVVSDSSTKTPNSALTAIRSLHGILIYKPALDTSRHDQNATGSAIYGHLPPSNLQLSRRRDPPALLLDSTEINKLRKAATQPSWKIQRSNLKHSRRSFGKDREPVDDSKTGVAPCSFHGEVTVRRGHTARWFAMQMHETPPADSFVLWVDGSLKDHKGGAGVTYRATETGENGDWADAAWACGNYKHPSAYAMELLAIKSGLQTAMAKLRPDKTTLPPETPIRKDVLIFSDCARALELVDIYSDAAGYPVPAKVIDILEYADSLHQLGVQVKLHLVPGHSLVPGNERADRLAKRAAHYVSDLPTEDRKEP